MSDGQTAVPPAADPAAPTRTKPTKRVHAKHAGGWPKGISRAAMARQKAAAKEATDKAIEAVSEMQAAPPPAVIPTVPPPAFNGATPPPSGARPPPAPTRPDWRERHRLRSAEEYPADEVTDQKFHIPKSRFPSGFDLVWVATSVWEQPLPEVRAQFMSKGWEPIFPEDFDGRFAYLVPREWDGAIILGGLMLCARSESWSAKARMLAEREAKSVIDIKIRQLYSGDFDTARGRVTLDSRKHLNQNNINVGVEMVGRSGEISQKDIE